MIIRVILFAVASVMAYSNAVANATDINGHVVRVQDGDTVTILDGNKRQHVVRLSGCDAPEISQAFGRASRESLANQVAGQAVTFKAYKKDKHSRAVGKLLHGGNDLCLYQVSAGMAWHFSRYAHEQSAEDRARYADAEKQARQARRGLWIESNPHPPWEYRRANRAQQ